VRQNGSRNTQVSKVIKSFTAKTEGRNRLGLRELLQHYADEQWVAESMMPEHAADSVLDCFKRAVRQELELLALGCRDKLDE
jgi:hypothetical protein